jgi:hypothetical protein
VTRLSPNAVEPCPSRSARVSHAAAGRICPVCEPLERWPVRCPLCLNTVDAVGLEIQPHRISGRGFGFSGFDCPGAYSAVPSPAWVRTTLKEAA